MKLPTISSALILVLFLICTDARDIELNLKNLGEDSELFLKNLGFDHQAHAVPGADKVVYDLDGSGSETVVLDGGGSHSHFFNPGPPSVIGVIEKYEWTQVADGKVICQQQACSVDFPVGKTQVSLKVWDNQGDQASEAMHVTVEPKTMATQMPQIDQLNPNQGIEAGGTIVTISGKFLYHDSKVLFGDAEASDIKYVDSNTIVCSSPPGAGVKPVKLVSSIGTSNTNDFTYQKADQIPVQFSQETWKNPDGSNWNAPLVTGIVLARNHRYYMSTYGGKVISAAVNQDLVVVDSCDGAQTGEGRIMAGIGFNPLDPQNRLFVTTNIFFHKKKGQRWDNGKVESVNIDGKGCPVKGNVIISGLPVSNYDHGVNKIIFNNAGHMLISVGGSTNAGVSMPTDLMGGVADSPLSGSIVIADYLKAGFNGNIVYDQYNSPGVANIVGGDVKTFANGLRNCFGMTLHSNGQIYATDNGPNKAFGKLSVNCNAVGEDAGSEDKLLRIVEGKYYGYPNRNRGRNSPDQCTYKHRNEASAGSYNAPIGWMKSSTTGVMEYTANSFLGSLRGSLFLSKAALEGQGTLFRADLTENGQQLAKGPYVFKGDSGLDITMGLWGEIVMPQIKKNKILVYKPVLGESSSISMINVQPNSGPAKGGNVMMVTGKALDQTGIKVFVGKRECTAIHGVHFNSLKCTVPCGQGKVKVTVRSGDIDSESFGDDYEYLGESECTTEETFDTEVGSGSGSESGSGSGSGSGSSGSSNGEGGNKKYLWFLLLLIPAALIAYFLFKRSRSASEEE